ARPPAARRALDEERGTRAPLLLRIRVGRVRGAAGPLGAVDDPAARTPVRSPEADRVRRHPRVHGQPRPPRTASAYTTDRAGGAGDLGLTSGPWALGAGPWAGIGMSCGDFPRPEDVRCP